MESGSAAPSRPAFKSIIRAGEDCRTCAGLTKGDPVVYGLNGIAEVAKEEDEVLSPPHMDDLIGELKREPWLLT